MLEAIRPSYANIKNALPKSAGVETQGMVSHFLFWIIQSQRLYSLSWLFGFVASIILYSCLCVVFPASETYVSKTIFGVSFVNGLDVVRHVDDSMNELGHISKEPESVTRNVATANGN